MVMVAPMQVHVYLRDTEGGKGNVVLMIDCDITFGSA